MGNMYAGRVSSGLDNTMKEWLKPLKPSDVKNIYYDL